MIWILALHLVELILECYDGNPSEYIYILRSDQERLRKMQHKVLW